MTKTERTVPRLVSSETLHVKTQVYTPFEGQCSNCGSYQVAGKRDAVIYCSSCGKVGRIL
jgi:hypothetical protein